MAYRLINGAEFLHIPKTGGMYVKNILDAAGLIDRSIGHKHSDWFHTIYYDRLGCGRDLVWTILRMALNKIKKEGAKSRFRFCFVRNPLSWYESFWRYSKSIGSPIYKYPHPLEKICSCYDDDFNCFIEKSLDICPGFVSEMYLRFVYPDISFVGRTENLEEDLKWALNLNGIYIDDEYFAHNLPKNESLKYPIDWSPLLMGDVCRMESLAFERFGYENRGGEKFEH